MNKRLWGSAEFGVILIFLVIITALITTRHLPPDIISARKPENGIPRIDINLRDISLEEINSGAKETKYPGNQLTVTTPNHPSITFDDVEVKGRGNSTWEYASKKPYQIKFANAVDLFGLGASRKYILLANAFDDTFIRNAIAFRLEQMLDERYYLSGEFVDLYVDSEYHGLYYLTQKVEIGKNRVNLSNPFGILLEFEGFHFGESICYSTINSSCFIIKEVVDPRFTEESVQDFIATFNQLELAVAQHDYATASSLADMEDFAKYYLLNEFTVNPDAYATSFFFYKDGVDDKIHAGPGWDFDLSLSNKRWGTDYEPFYSPYETQVMNHLNYDDTRYSNIVIDLTKMPEFMNLVKEIYLQTMVDRKSILLSYVTTTLEYIHSAAIRDQQLYDRDTFSTTSDELLIWLSKRYDYFEQQFNKTSSHFMSFAQDQPQIPY